MFHTYVDEDSMRWMKGFVLSALKSVCLWIQPWCASRCRPQSPSQKKMHLAFEMCQTQARSWNILRSFDMCMLYAGVLTWYVESNDNFLVQATGNEASGPTASWHGLLLECDQLFSWDSLFLTMIWIIQDDSHAPGWTKPAGGSARRNKSGRTPVALGWAWLSVNERDSERLFQIHWITSLQEGLFLKPSLES